MSTSLPSEFQKSARPGDLTPALHVLLAGGALSEAQAEHAFTELATGASHDGEIGAFLALLAARVPSVNELVGAVRVMRSKVERVPTRLLPAQLLDTAGTGGAPKSFNVSTLAAFVAAANGAKVAKHGNRSRTGRGSAETLERGGVNINASRSVQAKCLEECGICFCFAIHHHPAAKHAIGVRKALGFPTIFNLLGPLANPAGAARQVMGVYAPQFVRPVAEALLRLNATRALVLHSEDGLDEVSIFKPTRVIEVRAGALREWTIDPRALGLANVDPKTLAPSSLDEAAALFEAVLRGEERGPRRDLVLVNAAAAMLAADVVASMEEGIQVAAQSLDFGDAWKCFESLRELSLSS